MRALLLPALLLSLPAGVMSFALPLYAHGLGASPVQIGLYFTLLGGVMLLCRPLFGLWMDRGHKLAFFLAGAACQTLALLMFAGARQMGLLYLAALLAGVAASLCWTAAYALAAEGDAGSGEAMGRIDSAIARGALIGAIPAFNAVGFFTLERSWQPLMLVFAAAALLAVLLVCREGLTLAGQTQAGADRCATAVAARAVHSSGLWPLLLLVLLTSASTAMLLPVLTIYLAEKFAASSSTIAAAYIPAALVFSLLPAYTGRLADRVGSRWPMIAGLLLMALCALFIPLAGSLWLLIGLWVLEAAGSALAGPAERKLVGIAGGHAKGRVFGLYTMLTGLAAAVGPLLGGLAYQQFGPAMPFVINGLVLLAASMLLWRLRLPDEASAAVPLNATAAEISAK
ncbi:MFS transporter [Chitinilyticum litopenaei]|uniref:MFS transporter n=1 Tax=Chitinilyticum litopenaei TaxID=1121276 RepID=UPI000417CA24|nr:MFS transporter [Chitinilyticum litopenaei]